ncbi:MAG: hypothetical protein DWQ07_09465 [Chloroflexi bacterium]|nr:MAG: hypothetical protein DWQ07_09465 [Chloroflexota bacterium]MBL1193059.1 hypothetical protein [Chloroflexota bacterium]NOH10352.1 hypothetical protein [Chloroflexota bacterium]
MAFRFKLSLLLSLFLLVLVGCNVAQRTPTSIELSYDPNQPLTVGSEVDFDFSVDTVPSSEPFAIIVLPDTQYYSQKYPDIYLSQTQWIVDHHEKLNVAFVSHVGDIVQHDDQFEEQWVLADQAMGMLDGVVPYGVLPGNHDMQLDGTAILYNEYFPAARFEEYEWWGGSISGNKNNYQLFSAGMEEFLILHMQYCPTDEAVAWAQGVLEEHPDRRGIVTTHAYIETKGYRLPNCKKNSDGKNNAINLWQKMVAPYDNVELVLSGHIPGVGQRTDTVRNRTIYQLMADYQGMEEGGSGYLRIMRFYPLEDLIRIETYSPYLDAYMRDAENEFELRYELADMGLLQGEVTISAGEESCTATVREGVCTLTLNSAEIASVQAEYLGLGIFAPSSTEVRVEVAGE